MDRQESAVVIRFENRKLRRWAEMSAALRFSLNAELAEVLCEREAHKESRRLLGRMKKIDRRGRPRIGVAFVPTYYDRLLDRHVPDRRIR